MNLAQHSIGQVELVALQERLVMANSMELRRALVELVEKGRRNIVLDLGNVEFVDSSGLAVLVSTLKAANAESGEVVLLNPTKGVRSLIELTRLHNVFEIFEDKDAAIKRLS